ncbi:MAG: pyridoxal-phosphate dependent enzyme [Candidatus Paceibacterota bacterium]|jgi:cysteine synthase A
MDRYYLQRWTKWPLPVIPVPEKLNPFKADKVDLSIVLTCHLPYENIKFFTVLGMLLGAQAVGALKGVHTLVEATSGNTGVVLAAMAKSFEISKVKLVVAPDLPDGKRYPFLLAGAETIPPEEGLSPIGTARKLGGGGWREEDWHADNGILNLDQYANPYGTEPHRDFMASKILDQVAYPPTVFVAGVGTGGTLVGVSKHLRDRRENITIVGVLLKKGDEIPGVRDLARMKEITLPWHESLDEFVEVESRPSYLAALWFNWVMSITPGPSSGFAYLGALKYLALQKMNGKLDSLRDDRGRVHAVILFPDGNRPYGDRFMANLPSDYLKASTAPMPWCFPGHELMPAPLGIL